MGKYLLLIILSVSTTVFAQSNEYKLTTVAGDTSYVWVYSGMSGSCEESLTITHYGGTDPTILGPYNNRIRFTPNRNGIWYDTVTYYWSPTADFNNEGCQELSQHLTITGRAIQDSSVKLRPEYIDVSLTEQKSLGQWDGYFTIRLDNNIKSTTVFKNIRLRYNLPPGLQMELLNETQVIPSYSAKPFERNKNLTVHIWLPGAPLLDSVEFQGAFELDASSSDTTLQLQSNLHVTIHPFSSAIVETLNSDSYSVSVFPNPMRELSQVRLNLPHRADCHLLIRTILGEEIQSVYKGPLNRGIHDFPIRNLPAGEYFCELQIGEQNLMEKIIVLQ